MTVHRTSVIVTVCCLALFRQASPCSCIEASECVYAETPLVAEDVTPWDTTIAADIAILETPQPGTWRWGSSFSALEIEQADTAFSATATFVHDPASVRFEEWVAGGVGAVCNGNTVLIDGMLTFSNEQDEVIVSVPVTARRTYQDSLQYAAEALLSPVEMFSTELHPLTQYDEMGVAVLVNWINNSRLRAEFTYFTLTKTTPTTGDGVSASAAVFEPDP
jgi:hypothetical protein